LSAISFVLLPNRLHVIADTAAYLADDGILGPCVSKISLAEGFPGVVATMGNMWSGTLVKSLLADCIGFDDLIETAQALFEELAGNGHDLALAIGGFSDARGQFELWYGGTAMKQQFTWLATGTYCGGQPRISGEQWFKGFGKPMRSAAQIVDIDDFARTVLTLQRECRWGTAEGYPHDVCLVGGWGELATITRTGSDVHKIIEWPDVAGELIKPAAIDWIEWRRTHAEQADPAPAPANPAPKKNVVRLSRHERRAAKARARRQAA
jgi:hypothetical protein